jgi:predicted nucleic acid-binding protein
VSGFLVDTNVISEIVKPRPHPAVMRWFADADEFLIHFSVLTLGEIRKGISSSPNPSRKAQFETWLTALIDRFSTRILPVDLAIADRWGRLAGICRAKGMTLLVINGLLAATALHYDLTLVTRNVKDIQGSGADTLDPWSL